MLPLPLQANQRLWQTSTATIATHMTTKQNAQLQILVANGTIPIVEAKMTARLPQHMIRATNAEQPGAIGTTRRVA
jgi:hypothetical protein